MDQKKFGGFLKELRKEKGITQEQLGEILGVSGRTVSRWETGFNMPDLDLLIQMADYYGVEIRELLDGERKSESMDKEMKETVLKIADYSNDENRRFTRRLCCLFVIGLVAFSVYIFLEIVGYADTPMNEMLSGCMLGFAYGMMIVGVLYTSGYLAKLKALKMRLFKK